MKDNDPPGRNGPVLTLQSTAMPRLAAMMLLSVALASCAARGPWGEESHPRVTGIFSSMHYFGDETGDVGGIEVFITRAGDEGHCYVHFQVAEGVPGEPALVRASVTGHDIEFMVPEIGTFKGTVRADALVGRMVDASGNEEKVRLPRKKSYWQ